VQGQRASEANLITAGVAVVIGVGWVGGQVPGVGDAIGALVVGALLGLVAAVLLRWVARRVRWYREDREDERIVALRRAERIDRPERAEPVRAA
jgi:hypothetical protein